ncbi:hypothetical protein [Argonema antarcticum]|nr:hypothetical protein [Argonema antarcticum]
MVEKEASNLVLYQRSLLPDGWRRKINIWFGGIAIAFYPIK